MSICVQAYPVPPSGRHCRLLQGAIRKTAGQHDQRGQPDGRYGEGSGSLPKCGDAREQANSAGTSTAIYSYGPYGEPNQTTGTRFRYTGQQYLSQLGLYYYKARFYSSKLGRFLQTDPIGYQDDSNLYAYVGNNPINRGDPTGMTSAEASMFGGTFRSQDWGSTAKVADCAVCNAFDDFATGGYRVAMGLRRSTNQRQKGHMFPVFKGAKATWRPPKIVTDIFRFERSLPPLRRLFNASRNATTPLDVARFVTPIGWLMSAGEAFLKSMSALPPNKWRIGVRNTGGFILLLSPMVSLLYLPRRFHAPVKNNVNAVKPDAGASQQLAPRHEVAIRFYGAMKAVTTGFTSLTLEMSSLHQGGHRFHTPMKNMGWAARFVTWPPEETGEQYSIPRLSPWMRRWALPEQD